MIQESSQGLRMNMKVVQLDFHYLWHVYIFCNFYVVLFNIKQSRDRRENLLPFLPLLYLILKLNITSLLLLMIGSWLSGVHLLFRNVFCQIKEIGWRIPWHQSVRKALTASRQSFKWFRNWVSPVGVGSTHPEPPGFWPKGLVLKRHTSHLPPWCRCLCTWWCGLAVSLP